MPRKRPFIPQTETSQTFFQQEFRLSLMHDEESASEYKFGTLQPITVPYFFSVQIFHIVTVLYGLYLAYAVISHENYLHVGNARFLPFLLIHALFEYSKIVISRKLNNKSGTAESSILDFVSVYALTLFSSYVLTVLFGAELLENVEATFVFSCILTTLVIVPLLCTVGAKSFLLLCLQEKPANFLEKCLLNTSHSVILGAWLGAFVIPLDWDRSWQAWPIPCVVGSILGYTVGQILSFFQLLLYYFSLSYV